MPQSPVSSLIADDGELYFLPSFFPADVGSRLFSDLRKQLDWQEESIVIAGRSIKVPRRVCWYGDSTARYRYSGVSHDPRPWTDTLLHIKARVESECGHRFNSVLGNLYRDGRDSMGWHADKEKELGTNPVIASVSLGATRRFRLRHVRRGISLDLDLHNGSLLIMAGSLQHHWRHCLPKTAGECAERINLTFRRIMSDELE